MTSAMSVIPCTALSMPFSYISRIPIDLAAAKMSSALANRGVEAANRVMDAINDLIADHNAEITLFIAGLTSSAISSRIGLRTFGPRCKHCGREATVIVTLKELGQVELCPYCHAQLQGLLNKTPKPGREVIALAESACRDLGEAKRLDPENGHARQNFKTASDLLRQVTKTRGLAITSLVFGILSWTLPIFGSIPAVICGHVAINRNRRTYRAAGGMKRAIAGTVLGYASFLMCILIIALDVWRSAHRL